MVAENGTLSLDAPSAPTSGLIERIVKYIANNAAKNISSLDNHTMVPIATMLGRLTGASAAGRFSTTVAAATRGILAGIRTDDRPTPERLPNLNLIRPRLLVVGPAGAVASGRHTPELVRSPDGIARLGGASGAGQGACVQQQPGSAEQGGGRAGHQTRGRSPAVELVETATEPATIAAFDAGDISLGILDGEAAPGGMGIARQVKDGSATARRCWSSRDGPPMPGWRPGRARTQ